MGQPIADILARHKARTRSIAIPVDVDAIARLEELQLELRMAKRRDEAKGDSLADALEAPAVEAALDQAREEAERAAVTFTFQELARRDYRALIDAHPAQGEQAGKMRWDEDGFAPALMAACSVEPAMTVDEARRVWDEWGASVAYALFATAVGVNEEESRVPFGVSATNGTNGSKRSLTTPPSGESLTQSS